MKSKSFVFSITITEIIILLFFLLALLSRVKLTQKETEIANYKEEILKKENQVDNLILKLEIQKKMIIKLIDNPKAIDFFDELVNVEIYKTEIAKLKNENIKIKKLLDNLNNEKKSLDELEKYSSKLFEEINSKKKLLEALTKINNREDVNKIIDSLKESEQITKKSDDLKNVIVERDITIKNLEKDNNKIRDENISFAENTINMKGQVSFLNKKLNDKEGGNGLPPCWVDEKGTLEYLFYIKMYEDNIDVTLHSKAKKIKADQIINLDKIVNKTHNLSEFMSLSRSLYNKSVEDECRHYVLIKDFTTTKKAYKEKMLTIENHFYKYILRN